MFAIGYADIGHAYGTWSATSPKSGNSLNANGTFPTFYHAQITANSPWAEYRMGDASGNTATDSASTPHNGKYSVSVGSGTYATAAAPTSGTGDGAITLGGATANSGNPQTGVCGYGASDLHTGTSNTFTEEIWFKTAATTGGMLVDTGDYAGTNGFSDNGDVDRYLYINSSHHVEFGFGNGTNDSETPSTYNDGSWHLVDAVDNAGASSLYIDGSLKNGPNSGDSASTNLFWRIGCDDVTSLPKSSADNGFNGSLADFAIYPTALSSAKITNHWNARVATTYATTIEGDSPSLYWQLNNPTPNTVIADLSGNSQPGHYLWMSTGGSVTLGATGALLNAQSGPTAATYANALGVAGTSLNMTSGTASTTEMWFKAANAYALGGCLISIDSTNTGVPPDGDRVVWMNDAGNINFMVVVGLAVHTLTSPLTYNDGNWHMVDTSLGAAGQKLYVDGALVASNAGQTTGGSLGTSYWQWGYTDFDGYWAPGLNSYFFNGSLDEISIYTSQLSNATVTSDYSANY